MTCLQRPSLHVSAHVLYVSKCGKYLTCISNYQQENHGPQCSFRHLRNLAVIPQEYEGTLTTLSETVKFCFCS